MPDLTDILTSGDKPYVFLSERKQPAKGTFSFGKVRPAKKKKEPTPHSEACKIVPKKKGACYYCGCETYAAIDKKQEVNTATIDHKIPRSRGGKGGDNRVIACRSCNTDKASLTEGEYRAVLAYRLNESNNAGNPTK